MKLTDLHFKFNWNFQYLFSICWDWNCLSLQHQITNSWKILINPFYVLRSYPNVTCYSVFIKREKQEFGLLEKNLLSIAALKHIKSLAIKWNASVLYCKGTVTILLYSHIWYICIAFMCVTLYLSGIEPTESWTQNVSCTESRDSCLCNKVEDELTTSRTGMIWRRKCLSMSWVELFWKCLIC